MDELEDFTEMVTEAVDKLWDKKKENSLFRIRMCGEKLTDIEKDIDRAIEEAKKAPPRPDI
jgi:hypothetical protein